MPPPATTYSKTLSRVEGQLPATRLRRLLARFADQNILVVGDVMLDRYWWGQVSRISPEAPVPVVEVTRESFFPGGAANVARNLRAFGAAVQVVGVIGDDRPGEQLRALLDSQGVQTRGLLVDPSRPTTVKTRVIAQHQQVVRCDHERAGPLAPPLARRALEFFARQVAEADAVVFEDYAKGLLTQPLLDAMQGLARRHRTIAAADPNLRHRLRYRGLTAVTPNRAEAFANAGLPYVPPAADPLRDAPLRRVAERLLRQWQPQNLLITLGEHGMCLFRAGHKPHHIPTVAQEVFDVSGAGDTVIGTLALALAAGAGPVAAAEMSNHAAGVVVGKVGTATCSPAELLASFARQRKA